MLRYLPNSLTFLRLLLALPLGWLILREQYNWALVIGALAGVSDALDGYLAKRNNQTTELGAILDLRLPRRGWTAALVPGHRSDRARPGDCGGSRLLLPVYRAI